MRSERDGQATDAESPPFAKSPDVPDRRASPPYRKAEPADLVIDRTHLVTVGGGTGPLRGAGQGDWAVVPDGAVAVRDGRILAAGPREAVLAAHGDGETIDAGGRVVLPGFVDAHTHPLWAGDRAGEFARRVAGATYLEIMAEGGGIASTVRATRAASDDDLAAGLRHRLDTMLAHGTTTAEAKTGYGLSVEEELRQLDLLDTVGRTHPLRLVPTFLGAHAVPDEYRGRQGRYVDLVADEMLPAVAARHPGAFCDVFCDEGAFTVEEAERILSRARDLGMRLKVHSDEFASLGCTALAARLGAVSADHLAHTSPPEMDALARSGTVAVLLPGTTFGLASTHYAPAREMVARGVAVALGTDLNPGTCPCESVPLMLALATRYLRLTPAEAVVAATRNAAHACGLGDVVGRLERGWSADLIVLDADDPRVLGYAFGASPVAAVMAGGRWAWRAGRSRTVPAAGALPS